MPEVEELLRVLSSSCLVMDRSYLSNTLYISLSAASPQRRLGLYSSSFASLLSLLLSLSCCDACGFATRVVWGPQRLILPLRINGDCLGNASCVSTYHGDVSEDLLE